MISVIIPAYNEEKRIGKTLDSMADFFGRKNSDYEIIVSANGCWDGTENLMRKYAEKNTRIKMISFQTPGKGLALQRGFNASNGNIIVFADADSSSGPEEICKLVEELKEYDVVIGSRTDRTLIKIKQPFRREIFGRFMSLLVRIMFRIGIRDTQCGYKAFKREILENAFHNVKSSGFEFDVELLVKIKRLGYSIKEAPIRWDNDAHSKVRVFPDALKMLYGLIKFRVLL